MKRKSVDGGGGEEEEERGGGGEGEELGEREDGVRAVIVSIDDAVFPAFPAPPPDVVVVVVVVVEDDEVAVVEGVETDDETATVGEEGAASAGNDTVMDVVMEPFPELVVLVEMVTGPAESAVTTEAVTDTPVDLTVAVCVPAVRPPFACCCWAAC